MNLCMIGTGYVGLVSGACLADVGNTVWCVDKDEAKVTRLAGGDIPIHEPGLKEIVERNVSEGRLYFTSRLKEALAASDICFITVNTPPDGDGKADVSNVLAAARELGELMVTPKIIITKSTVPVGTTKKVKEVIAEALQARGLDSQSLLRVANNPEFLKEGAAVEDFMKPDRVIIGVDDDEVGRRLHDLYQPFMRKQDRCIQMDIASSELCKYAANSMLAARISFMNEMAELCEAVGADVNAIRVGLGSDPRIGPSFLYAGLGFGGSCFPKDLKALIQLGREQRVSLSVVAAAERANQLHRDWFWKKVTSAFSGSGLAQKRIAVWGVAFKPETDDIREAPALDFIQRLLREEAHVYAYDPVAGENARRELGPLGEKVFWCDGSYDCLEGADALIVCTEWREFRSPDFERIRELMRRPLIFDGRLLYEPWELKRLGIECVSIGRPLIMRKQG